MEYTIDPNIKTAILSLCSARLIAEFRKGFGAMFTNAIDFYANADGTFVKHEWAMGGQSKSLVDKIPENISGYKRIS
jgi:hypothetical protein